MNPKVILMILDGWGIGPDYPGNAILNAPGQYVNGLASKWPNTRLKTSGLAVGLPEGQMGNSEVGHLNIGAGRVVYQMLVKIQMAFENGLLKNAPELSEAVKYALENNKKIHLLGLVSDGGVHSHHSHFSQLCEILYHLGMPETFIHAFTDGRDTDPRSGQKFLDEVIQASNPFGGKVASIIGRYFAMDRDKRWERVAKAYHLLTSAEGKKFQNPMEAIKWSYQNGVTDEFIEPICITKSDGQPMATIADGDVVLFVNFRTDRGRELTQALSQEAFPEYNMRPLALHYITMTQYNSKFQNVKVLMENEEPKMTLGEVLEKNVRSQVRIAETEKYPHVTFFFSGGREDPFSGETRVMIPSPKVPTYDLQPEMSAEGVKQGVLDKLDERPDFIVVNFANPDMVGHTGVLSAEMKAIETVDGCAKEIIEKAVSLGYTLLVTADHGNGEWMINEDGSPNTAHTTFEVPLYLINGPENVSLIPGKLADIAPTVLELLGIPQPLEMSGISLLNK